MTPEREKSIRSHWRAYRGLAREPLLATGRFRVPVKQKVPALTLEAVEPTAEVPIYEYRIEHGFGGGKALTRIVCEGVEVEVSPRAPW